MIADMTAMRRRQRHKRSEARQLIRDIAMSKLKDEGIDYAIANRDSHLVLTTNTETIDFFPTTGEWKIRASNRSGIDSMIEYLRDNS